jgi:putative hydrolase of the HAD superfamily
VPFAREHGSSASPADIADKARLLSLGRMTSADFWRSIGVAGDPNELDNAYLASHQLNPGVVRYLRSLRDQGFRLACITNDSAAWAMKLRTGHSLGGLIDPWVVSGSVGVRKPDGPLYEVLRRVTGEPTSAILVIDDDLDNLDAARELGFGTRWFTREGDRADARGHEVMRGFEGFSPVDTSDIVIEERPEEPSDPSDRPDRPGRSGPPLS